MADTFTTMWIWTLAGAGGLLSLTALALVWAWALLGHIGQQLSHCSLPPSCARARTSRLLRDEQILQNLLDAATWRPAGASQ
jgi:hypothetical protein